jgi:lipid-binding SYLF domain-containing protein
MEAPQKFKNALWAAIPILFTLLVFNRQAFAATAQEINQEIDSTLNQFKKVLKNADEFLKASKGVLVIPRVKKLGFIMGSQSGQGALRVHDKTVAYYRMDSGSLGFRAGFKKTSLLFLFLTNEALKKFRAVEGWTVGAENGITIVDKGFGGSVDSLKNTSPVVGFAIGPEGMMGGWSAKGSKFTEFEPGE